MHANNHIQRQTKTFDISAGLLRSHAPRHLRTLLIDKDPLVSFLIPFRDDERFDVSYIFSKTPFENEYQLYITLNKSEPNKRTAGTPILQSWFNAVFRKTQPSVPTTIQLPLGISAEGEAIWSGSILEGQISSSCYDLNGQLALLGEMISPANQVATIESTPSLTHGYA